jgi:hypothetical protein
MEKETAVTLAYQIATLSSPSQEVLDLLVPIKYERVLELLLVLRQSPQKVKSPAGFLRRAISEGWTPETMPEPVARREIAAASKEVAAAAQRPARRNQIPVVQPTAGERLTDEEMKQALATARKLDQKLNNGVVACGKGF